MNTNNRYLPLFLLFLMVTVTTAHAQTEVSIKAGAHYSNLILKAPSGDEQDTQFKPGWQIGLAVDVPLGRALFLQPGLQYSRKGFTQDDSWFAGTGNDFRVSVNYIELPLNLLYKPSLGSGRLLIGGGPYLAYGRGGTWEADEPVLIGDVMIENNGKVNFIKDLWDGEWGEYSYGKPWDYGATITAGYEFFDRLSAQFNVKIGLANLEPHANDSKANRTRKNIGFGVSLGYEL
jgi:hypothetical protein